MKNYVFSVSAVGSKSVDVVTSKALREAPITLKDGREVSLDDVGGIYCQDIMLRDGEEVEVPNGPDLILAVTEVFAKAQDDPTRIARKYCLNCFFWDRDEGKKAFQEETHQYGNGSFSMIEEVTKAVASKNRLRPLTAKIVGYCPVHLKLCSEGAMACPEYDPRPWFVRLRNWFVRMFR